MRLDEIHDDAQAEAMRRIDEFLQFVRRSEKVADGEEIRDMVAEGAIERMLLDGHQLDGVVACIGDARKRQLLEFTECANGVLLLRHADMCFVDER